jgi:protein-tyrosine phosphatase
MSRTSDPMGGLPFRVLLVCTANLCRSPMAEYLLRARSESAGLRWTVESAGVQAEPGLAIHPLANRALKERGLDPVGFRSRQLDPGQIAAADLVLTATSQHRRAVVTMDADALPRTFLLLQFARLLELGQIDDGQAEGVGPRLLRMARTAQGRTQPASPGHDELSDPVGRPLRAFRQCADLIDLALDQVVRPLRIG